MRAHYTERFLRHYAQAPVTVQNTFDKQIKLLIINLRHPSLRAKKYDEAQHIWQARVTKGWRFYFTIEGNTYKILSILPHPK